MKNLPITAFGIALLLLFSFSFADAAGAAAAKMKISALDEKVKPLLAAGELAGYDNFFGKDGKEYVIANINGEQTFMLVMVKNGTNYSAEFVRNASKMAEVYNARVASYGNLSALFAQIPYAAMQAAKFNSSRSLVEKRCSQLLGIGKVGCNSATECETACKASALCNEMLAGDKNILNGMIAYSGAVGKMDAAAADIANVSAEFSAKGGSVELLDKLNASVAAMENASVSAQQSGVAGATAVCPALTYDAAALDDAAAKTSAMQTASQSMKSAQNGLASMVKALARLPKIIEAQAPEAKNESAEANATAAAVGNATDAAGNATLAQAAQNNTAKNETAIAQNNAPSNVEPPKQNDDLIVKIIALVIIAGLAYFAYLKFGKTEQKRTGL